MSKRRRLHMALFRLWLMGEVSERDSFQNVLGAIGEVDSTTHAAMDAEGCW